MIFAHDDRYLPSLVTLDSAPPLGLHRCGVTIGERLCETFAQPHKTSNYVIPAQAGIPYYQALPGFRFSPE